MSIDLQLLFATPQELALRCRGWGPRRLLAKPRKRRRINPFTKKPHTFIERYEEPSFDAAFSPLPLLDECLLTGKLVGRPFVTDGAIGRLVVALDTAADPDDQLPTVLTGPAAGIDAIPPTLSAKLRTESGLARARELAPGIDVQANLVEALAADARLAGDLGREMFLYASVDGTSETWTELFEAIELHLAEAAPVAALLRGLVEDVDAALAATPPAELAARVVDGPLAPWADRVLVLAAQSALQDFDYASLVVELVLRVVAQGAAADEHARAAVAWTFPAMVQLSGMRNGSEAAFRVLRALPAERELVRALYLREIEHPHRGVETRWLVDRLPELGDLELRAPLDAVVARGGSAAVHAAEHLLVSFPDVSAAHWVDAILKSSEAHTIARSLAARPRAAACARVADALAVETHAQHMLVLADALVHLGFGERGLFDRPATSGELAVLVTDDGIPVTTRLPLGNLIREWARIVGVAIQIDPDGRFEGCRWSAAVAPRAASSLSADERGLLRTLHDRAELWSRPFFSLRAHGLPASRHELGALLGIPTPPRQIGVPHPTLGAPLQIHAHDDVDAEGLGVLHDLRDFLDEIFSAPSVVYRKAPADPGRPAPRPGADGQLVFGMLATGPGWRGGPAIIVCRGPATSHVPHRFGIYENSRGAFSLHAILEGRPQSELRPRALRVLGQVALATFRYPPCPNPGCLMTPVSTMRPRGPDDRIIINAFFGRPSEIADVPLALCVDCTAVAALHAGRSSAEQSAVLEKFLRTRGLPAS